MIDPQDDACRCPILVEVGHGDVRALILPGDPIGDLIENKWHDVRPFAKPTAALDSFLSVPTTALALQVENAMAR